MVVLDNLIFSNVASHFAFAAVKILAFFENQVRSNAWLISD